MNCHIAIWLNIEHSSVRIESCSDMKLYETNILDFVTKVT